MLVQSFEQYQTSKKTDEEIQNGSQLSTLLLTHDRTRGNDWLVGWLVGLFVGWLDVSLWGLIKLSCC